MMLMLPHWKEKFAILWTGQALSIFTSMVSQYALVWYLTDLTGSSTVLSLVTLAAMLPQGLLSMFTGAFADRFDRRVIMAAADLFIGALSLGLALLALRGPLALAPILAVVTLRSVGGAFHAPCLQAVTPLIAPPESLTKCAGWSQGIQTVSMLLSPALAAALYAMLPLHLLLLMDTLGSIFATGGLLLARLPALRVGQEQKLRLWQDTKEGFAVLRSHRWLWELCLICALFSVAFMPVSALFPLMSMQYFGQDTAAAALVETAFSAGMLAGSVILGLWGGGKDKILTMMGSVFAMGGALVVTGLLPPSGFWWFAGMSLVMGLTCPFFNSVFMALIQKKIAPEYLGRVLGLSGAIMTLASPLGLAATALLAERTGLTLWFLLSGGVTLLCGVLGMALPAVRGCDRN